MLVYGDQRDFADPAERLRDIDESVRGASAMPAGLARHAQLAGALVDAGRVLQGVADAEFEAAGVDRRTAPVDALTGYVQAIASALCQSWDSGFGECGAAPEYAAMSGLPPQVELRVPEGFAYYAVYPEAYIEAARRLRLSGEPRVIGIRSIGTTLGAVVAAALDAAPAVTVRPHGEPFARRIAVSAELERELLAGEPHYIIVDEGPGQSGSSFGAVADWLQQRGVPLERIAFVPSHGGAPGPKASAAQRERWLQVQRQTGDFGERLAHLIDRWLGESLGGLTELLSEISAGHWRSHLYASEAEWPAVVPAWERRKFLATANGRRLLVKFAGVGTIGKRKLAMARALHSAGFASEPLALVHGFLVELWCDNTAPLSDSDRPVAKLAAYIGARARLFPAAPSDGATLHDLYEMSRRNVALALGNEAAAAVKSWHPRLDALSRRVVRVRTDNKMDAHEWLRSAGGRLIKTDALDHHAAHDLVGCQDMAWDVAGAISEFALGEAQARELIALTEQRSGRSVDPELLDFYRMAYAAFRLGQASMGAEMAPREAARLRASAQRYASQLQLLLEPGTPATRRESVVG